MELKEKLQELRKQKGLTQEELAKALYVSRTAISKWESGRGTPSIESIKAIAKYFSLSIDELLSSDEILILAEEEGKNKEVRIRDLVFGLLDFFASLLLCLPLFAERSDSGVFEVSLLLLENSYLKVLYLILVIVMSAFGILTLALQNCSAVAWNKSKTKISLILGASVLLVFVISLHPYAAVFSFVLLLVKGILLFKHS